MQWYVADDGTQKGPFSEPALIEYLRARNLEHLFVWREGFETWMRARDVPEVMRLVRPAPPIVAVRELRAEGGNTLDTPADKPRRGKSRKRRWTKGGALIGLLGAASVLAARGDPELQRL